MTFIISHFINCNVFVLSARIWWIYFCKSSDSSTVISIKIIVSSLCQLMSSACALVTIIFMHSVATQKDEDVGYMMYFFTYMILILSLKLNFVNCIKLLLLIIKFARESQDEEALREGIPELPIRSREDLELNSQFEERARMIIEQISESRRHRQREHNISQVERFEARGRRQRRRRILRHLRNRGIQEGTIQAIRHILEATLERNEEDSPEERVKIYSRIERVLYENEKHGDSESCPI